MTDEGRYNEARGRSAEGGGGSNGSRSTRDTVVQRGVLNLEHLTQILTDSQWFSRKFVVCIWYQTPGQY